MCAGAAYTTGVWGRNSTTGARVAYFFDARAMYSATAWWWCVHIGASAMYSNDKVTKCSAFFPGPTVIRQRTLGPPWSRLVTAPRSVGPVVSWTHPPWSLRLLTAPCNVGSRFPRNTLLSIQRCWSLNKSTSVSLRCRRSLGPSVTTGGCGWLSVRYDSTLEALHDGSAVTSVSRRCWSVDDDDVVHPLESLSILYQRCEFDGRQNWSTMSI